MSFLPLIGPVSYDKARTIKKAQDAYCDKVLANDWADLGAFPDDFQWDPLVDVLRGRVKVHTHCYEAVDFDSFVRVRFTWLARFSTY